VRPARSVAARRWDRVRHVLLLVVLTLLTAIVLTGERPATWAELRERVRAGEVEQVTVSGELLAGSIGYSTVEVTWRDGLFHDYVWVRQVRGHNIGQVPTGLPRLHTAPSVRLQELAPGLSVVRGPERFGGDEFLGWRVASALQVGLLLTWFLTVLLLVAAPRTWRATPFAWFWLLLTPVGVPAFLLLAGPTPGLPEPRDSARRLTGGWAFLLLLAVGWGQAAG
jgi:hypothetical protein